MLQFEKYQQYAGGELAGANYDTFGVGQVFAAGLGLLGNFAGNHFGLEQVEMTNEANERIAQQTNNTNVAIANSTNKWNYAIQEATNKTNKQIADEANKLAREESEKAYQRSTQTNQIAELMRAGFSAQQAKQIVAGSGSPASYPAAPVQAAQMQAAQMQAAHVDPYTMQAYQPDLSSMSQAFAQLGSGLETMGNDFMQLNGGAFGTLMAKDSLDDFSQHMGELEDDFWDSPQTMQNYVNSEDWQKNHSWFGKKEMKHFKNATKSFNGQRALMEQGRLINSNATISNQVKDGAIVIKQKQIQLNIDRALEQTRVLSEKTALELQQMQADLLTYKCSLAPQEFAVEAQKLQIAFTEGNMNLKQLQNPQYREAWAEANLSNLRSLKALADAKRIHAEYESKVGAEKLAFAEVFSPYIATWEIFDDAGLTKTNAGIIAAALLGSATGMASHAEDIKQLVYEIFGKEDASGTYNKQKQKAASAVNEAAANSITSLEQKYESIVNP